MLYTDIIVLFFKILKLLNELKGDKDKNKNKKWHPCIFKIIKFFIFLFILWIKMKICCIFKIISLYRIIILNMYEIL